MRNFGAGLLLTGIISLLAGCGGNPAGAPSPPLEVPTPAVLKFVSPQGLQIDLGDIASGTSILDSAKELLPGDPILDIIQPTPDLITTFFDLFFTDAINGIQEIEIPTDTSITTYEDDVTFSAATGFLANFHNVKLDFSPFDYDGDGTDEACSGNSEELPICIRFWLGNTRFLAGVFTAFPQYETSADLPDLLGSGRFTLFIEDWKGYELRLSYGYAQEAATPELKTVSYFAKMTAVPNSPNLNTGLNFFREQDLRAELSREDFSSSALVRVNASIQLLDAETWFSGLFEDFEQDESYLGQFFKGGRRWSGSIDRQRTIAGVIQPRTQESNICASLPYGIVVETSECDDLGISVGDAAFVDPVSDATVNLPNDFPEGAPF